MPFFTFKKPIPDRDKVKNNDEEQEELVSKVRLVFEIAHRRLGARLLGSLNGWNRRQGLDFVPRHLLKRGDRSQGA